MATAGCRCSVGAGGLRSAAKPGVWPARPTIHTTATALFITDVPHLPPRCTRLTDRLRFECDYPSQALDIFLSNRQRCPECPPPFRSGAVPGTSDAIVRQDRDARQSARYRIDR